MKHLIWSSQDPQQILTPHYTLYKTLVDINFTLGSDQDHSLIRENVSGLLKVLQQKYPEAKILLLHDHYMQDTNTPKVIFTNENIPVNLKQLADYTGKPNLLNFPVPNDRLKICIQLQYTYFQIWDQTTPVW